MSTAAATQQERPEWIQVLDEECERTSQKRVSRKLRQPDNFPSPTVINQVLKDKYPSPTDRIQALVEGAFMGKTVRCPVLDEITHDICIEKQELPFAATNPQRVKLFRACKTCPNRRA